MINPDTNILSNTAIFNEESDIELEIFDTEVMDAINTLKEGKSPGINNITGELIKHGGNSVVKILTVLCQTWNSKTWPAQ